MPDTRREMARVCSRPAARTSRNAEFFCTRCAFRLSWDSRENESEFRPAAISPCRGINGRGQLNAENIARRQIRGGRRDGHSSSVFFSTAHPKIHEAARKGPGPVRSVRPPVPRFQGPSSKRRKVGKARVRGSLTANMANLFRIAARGLFNRYVLQTQRDVVAQPIRALGSENKGVPSNRADWRPEAERQLFIRSRQ